MLVERELDKVIKRFQTLSGSSANRLQKLIDLVGKLKTSFDSGKVISWRIIQCNNRLCSLSLANCGGPHGILTTEQVEMIKAVQKDGKDACQSISSEHKDIHATISKFGRAIDKVNAN